MSTLFEFGAARRCLADSRNIDLLQESLDLIGRLWCRLDQE